MEKYTKAQMEVIEFENEDVITESIPIENCPYDGGCKVEDLFCTPDGDCSSVLWGDYSKGRQFLAVCLLFV